MARTPSSNVRKEGQNRKEKNAERQRKLREYRLDKINTLEIENRTLKEQNEKLQNKLVEKALEFYFATMNASSSTSSKTAMTGLTQTDGLHPTGNDAATLDPAQFHMQQLASSKAAMTMPANFRTQLLANSEAEMTELLQLQTQPSASSDPAMTGPASSNTAMTRPESNYASNIVPMGVSTSNEESNAQLANVVAPDWTTGYFSQPWTDDSTW